MSHMLTSSTRRPAPSSSSVSTTPGRKPASRTCSDVETCAHLEDVFRDELGRSPTASQQTSSNGSTSSSSKTIDAFMTMSSCWATRYTRPISQSARAQNSRWKTPFLSPVASTESYDVSQALPEFQRMRKPVVDELQTAAESSMTWLEHARKQCPSRTYPADLRTDDEKRQDRLRETL